MTGRATVQLGPPSKYMTNVSLTLLGYACEYRRRDGICPTLGFMHKSLW